MPSSGASRCSARNKFCLIRRTDARANRSGAFKPVCEWKEAGDTVSNRLGGT